MTEPENKQQSLLTFRVGPVLCCAPSLPVRSIITPPRLTHPPGSDESQPGIFRHDGHIVKVIDLRQKFGIDKNEQTQPGNLIISRFSDNYFAFWVDQILDVFDFPATGWGNLPAAIPRGVFSRTLLLNKKIHLYSEFEKLCTIHDLGYLKHYIQQLRQEQNKANPAPAEATAKITQSSELTQQHAGSETVATNSPAKNPAIPADKVQLSSRTVAATKSHALPTKNKAAEKTKTHANLANTSPGKNIPPVKTPPSPASLNSALSKNPVPGERAKPTQSATVKKHTAESKPSPSIVKPSGRENKQQTNESEKYSAPLANNKITTAVKPYTAVAEADVSHDEKSSGSGFIILFLLILLSGFAAALYYVLFQQSAKTAIYQPAIEQTAIDSTAVQTENKATPDESEPLSLTENIGSVADKTKDASAAIPAADHKTNVSAYHAEIIQQDNEITITIDNQAAENTATTSEPTNNTELTIPAIGKNTETETAAKNSEADIIKTAEKNTEISVKAPPAKKVTKEIIHIVVKGDTLWAIAQKYVNNPFLYPELARLSNIKNPHRIYPGNRVTIRFINH